MTLPRSFASIAAAQTADPCERSEQVVGLAAREVDQVGLADCLGVGRVVGVGALPDEDDLDLGPEPFEMLDAEGRPAQEDLLAVRP